MLENKSVEMNLTVDTLDRPVNDTEGQFLPVADDLSVTQQGLSAGREFESMLARFLEPVLRLTGSQAGLVRTLSDDGEHLLLFGCCGLPADVRRAELCTDRHCDVCGLAAHSNTLTFVSELRSCANRKKDGELVDKHFKCMLAVPLCHREQLLGVCNLFFKTCTELSTDTLSLLRSIGELLGLTLHNARLERQKLRASVTNERKFLASEVHDSIAQTLVFVNMRLPLLHDAIRGQENERALRYLSDVKQAVASVHSNLRQIMTNFRCAIDPQGLLHALEGLADEFTHRTAVAMTYVCDVTDLGLSVEQELQVFHIVQEALANISHHAQARQACLTIRRVACDLEFLIEDDGRGLADRVVAGDSHFGLGIMKERAQHLGARIVIGAGAKGGTRVCLVVPQPRMALLRGKA